MDDIFVHCVDFKNGIPAASTSNDDGSYSIFLNSRLSREAQADAYKHEIRHIRQLDFEKYGDNVDVLEYYAHNICEM